MFMSGQGSGVHIVLCLGVYRGLGSILYCVQEYIEVWSPHCIVFRSGQGSGVHIVLCLGAYRGLESILYCLGVYIEVWSPYCIVQEYIEVWSPYCIMFRSMQRSGVHIALCLLVYRGLESNCIMFRSIQRSGVHIVLCLGVDRALECNLKLSSKITAKENRASDYSRNLFLIEIIFLTFLF